MKKRMIIGMALFLVGISIFSCCVYYAYLHGIDTAFATEYSKVLGSYDLSIMDDFLDPDTQITCPGYISTYKELRANVLRAFDNKLYHMDSSYGHGNDRFVDGLQSVGAYAYVSLDQPVLQENNELVTMVIEQTGPFTFRVKSLHSDGTFFEYLFFGEDMTIQTP